MSDLIYKLDGKTKSFLEVYDDYVIIKHVGFLNKSIGMEGEHRINFQDIVSIKFKKANFLSTGYIGFNLNTLDNLQTFSKRVQDPHTVMIQAGRKKAGNLSEEIANYLNEKIMTSRELK